MAAGGFVSRAFESMLKECASKKYPDLQKAIQIYIDNTKEVHQQSSSTEANQASSSAGDGSIIAGVAKGLYVMNIHRIKWLYHSLAFIHPLEFALIVSTTPLVANFSSSMLPLCLGDERSALLHFKESFIISNNASYDLFAYPKVESWKIEGGSGNCCSWDGIKCDENTGHVIGLDLTSSCLYGSINSSSSLFRLVHLEWLSLSDNDFNYSEIPSGIGNLSRLSHLDLSSSAFSGQIPSEIFELSKLVFLDLSLNSVKLQKPGLRSLVEKLTNLKELHLTKVNISSTVPPILANLSSLTSLLLRDCGLHGDFPTGIFLLPNLQFLSVRFNPNLTGYLPEFPRGSPLEALLLAGTSFSGELPNSVGNLKSLNVLDISNCYLHGPIPKSISSLVNIEFLSLQFNDLSGKVDFDLFSKLKNLTNLQLSANNLSVITKPSINVTLPKFKLLGLASCDLNEFPDFLQNQDELEILELSHNKIHGQIPKCFWNLNKNTLLYLDLNSNFLTGFDQPLVVLPWSNLRFLNLASNILQGSLPIPPPSIFTYNVSNNKLTGEISPFFCNLTSVNVLDLSNNNLGGMPPHCLGNLSNSLSVLNLRKNKFRGKIPQKYIKGCKLRMIDFSQNQLQGKVPRSLADCAMLQVLNLGNNQINDTFPAWLGTLAELKVLILRSNEFHSAVEEPKTKFEFSMLHIIDLSNNSFTGKLPSQHFQMWNAMKNFDADLWRYLEADAYYDFSMATETYYEKIQEFLVAIDLSSNRFEGDIPEDIGNLKALRLLNLSNNILTGHIPSSVGNLTRLESLDLSQNKLVGEIPQQLSQLAFLEFLNVSYNHLTGPIPQGKQFNIFQNNSFDGNPGLCGNPLSKKC